MSVLITGHTKGIGKQIFDRLSNADYNVNGISRSANYDIADINIKDFLDDIDVFVNNAYAPDHQTRLLKDAIEHWRTDKSKLIININSKMALLPIKDEHLNDWSKEYIQNKKEQTDIITKEIISGGVKICNIVVGLVETEMSSGVFKAPTMLDPTDIAQTIQHVIELSDRVNIQSIVIDAPGLNWQDIERIS